MKEMSEEVKEEFMQLQLLLFKNPAKLNILNEVYKRNNRRVDKTSLLTEISSVTDYVLPEQEGDKKDFYDTRKIECDIDNLKSLGLILEEANTLIQTDKGLNFFNYLMNA